MNSRVLSRIEKKNSWIVFRHAQKRVLSVAERSFVSGQRRILSWTEESPIMDRKEFCQYKGTGKRFVTDRKEF